MALVRIWYVCQGLDMLEFFAGRGNVSRVMKLSGLRTGSLDIKYPVKTSKPKPRSGSTMDLLSPAGFAIPVCIRSSHL